MVEGEVLVSDVAKGLCLGKSFRFEELEPQLLKGFNQPVKSFVVEH